MNVVQLVVDLGFGQKLNLLANGHPLWIVESEANRHALAGCPPPYRLVTWFRSRANESPQQMFARITPSLDQHHSELAQDPPYDTLDVYGLPAETEVLSAVEDLGFVSQTRLIDGTRFLKTGAQTSRGV